MNKFFDNGVQKRLEFARIPKPSVENVLEEINMQVMYSQNIKRI